MNSKTRYFGSNEINKRRGFEPSVPIDAGSPINAGYLLNAGVSRSVLHVRGVYQEFCGNSLPMTCLR